MNEQGSARDDPDTDRGAPNTLLNGLIGGLVGVILSFVPFSTVLGGGVAGYLEGGDYVDGAKVGTIAGLIAFIPFVVFLTIGLALVPVFPDLGFGLAVWVVVLMILMMAAIYGIGLSILGGIIGVYLHEEL